MTVSALIAVRLAEEVMGLNANERWRAVKQVDSSNPLLSRWFTIAMVIVLTGSIAALAIVSLFKKIRERKAAKKVLLDNAAKRGPAKSGNGTASVQPVNGSMTKAAFIAMFPSIKKAALANGGVQALSPPGIGAEWSRQIPEFLPATVTGLVGRVVFLETTLKTNVGDRVLVVIGATGFVEGAKVQEIIEDIGLVQQSFQPAETIKTPDSRRLAIELVSITEQQSAQIAGLLKINKATLAAEAQPAPSETAQPVGVKEEPK
jgi:hypothetical protein